MNGIEESYTEHSWPCLHCCGLNDASQFSLSALASLSALLPLVPANESAVCDLGMLLVGREFFLFCDGACVGGGSHDLVCDSFCDLGQTLPASGSQAPFQEAGRAGLCISIWHQVQCVFSLYLPLSRKECVWTQDVPLPLAVSLILMLPLSCISFPSSFSFLRFELWLESFTSSALLLGTKLNRALWNLTAQTGGSHILENLRRAAMGILETDCWGCV